MVHFSECSTVAASFNTEMQIEMRDGTAEHFPELLVVGPEVVAPLRDAVRLVDHDPVEQAAVVQALQHAVQPAARAQLLRRDVQQRRTLQGVNSVEKNWLEFWLRLAIMSQLTQIF